MHKHFYLFSALLIVTAFLSCDSVADKENTKTQQASIVEQSAYLIDYKQLLEWQGDSTKHVLLLDIRKKQSFSRGHLAGAVQLWRPDFSTKAPPYSGMRLSKDSLELLLQRLGHKQKHPIVLYDAKGNPDAAKLWWMLRLYGYEKAFILNKGLKAVDSSAWTTDSMAPIPSSFAFNNQLNKQYLASKNDVIRALNDSNTVLLDCRSEAEFSGKTLKKGAFRAGHIPGAINIDYSEAIAYECQNSFRSLEQLQKRFASLPKNRQIIVYCQSGVRSALLTFVLRELLDYPFVSNYDGSWIEWSYHIDLPIVCDAPPNKT